MPALIPEGLGELGGGGGRARRENLGVLRLGAGLTLPLVAAGTRRVGGKRRGRVGIQGRGSGGSEGDIRGLGLPGPCLPNSRRS
jgi:hypothetical protein